MLPSDTVRLSWGELQAALVKSLAVKFQPRNVPTMLFGNVRIPLTTAMVHSKSDEYRESPHASSLSRKLQNTCLHKIAQTGIFSEGIWLDIGGSRAYGDWLKFEPDRYEVFNLPGVAETTVEGDFNDASSIDFSRQYDGLISLNSLYMAKRPTVTIASLMRLLRPGGLVVLEFSSHSYWYVSGDGDHCSTFNPLSITTLLTPYLKDFMLIPVGNLLHASANYYSRRKKLRRFRNLIVTLALKFGTLDRDPRTALHYIAIGQKR